MIKQNNMPDQVVCSLSFVIDPYFRNFLIVRLYLVGD